MKIGIFHSSWSNIGNAFFELGLMSFLRNYFGNHEYFSLEDPAPPKTPRRDKLNDNVFRIATLQDVDLYVFTGPILKRFVLPEYDYKSLIRDLKKRGKQYAILSASSSEMSNEQVQEVAAFLNEVPPVCFATRDEDTYNRFKSLVSFCHNGICCAFLIPFIDGVATVRNNRPYFISSFYKSPEPYFSVQEEKSVTVDTIELKPRKPILPVRLGYSRHFERFRKDYAASLETHDIVRVHQGFNPAMTWFNYGVPNSFVSYNPRCYLSVYKGCDFVVTDRVHACAAALAYGHPARLIGDNDRIGIFSRMGILKDERGIMQPLPKDLYNKQVEEFKCYLSMTFGD
jgi:hypothetical protein